ncbi:DUF6783 domain-containing protein [Blautia glucerasea]|uniref:DUF6783 domain-containing protein n=1 Tax=Blautia glucerasea TaxID=536633 RepID=UPI00299F5513|nr:DUF6783 domain-containing protein [Blautia glucerasea]
MCVTICWRFCLNSVVVAGYDNQIQTKHTAQWGIQIAKMFFSNTLQQTNHACRRIKTCKLQT